MYSMLAKELQLKPCSVILERSIPFLRPATKDKNKTVGMKHSKAKSVFTRSSSESDDSSASENFKPAAKDKKTIGIKRSKAGSVFTPSSSKSDDSSASENFKAAGSVFTSSSSESDDSSASENVRSIKRKNVHKMSTSRKKNSENLSKNKLLSCSLCEDTFNTYKSLCSHMLTHKEFPFKCVICKEKFKFRTAFVNHMKRYHPESKLYVCSYPRCKLSYHKKIDRENHQKMHYKYVCKYCKKRFARKSPMQAHVIKIH